MFAIWAVSTGSRHGILLDRVGFCAYVAAVWTLPSARSPIGIAWLGSVASVAFVCFGEVQDIGEDGFARLLILLRLLALWARPAISIQFQGLAHCVGVTALSLFLVRQILMSISFPDCLYFRLAFDTFVFPGLFCLGELFLEHAFSSPGTVSAAVLASDSRISHA